MVLFGKFSDLFLLISTLISQNNTSWLIFLDLQHTPYKSKANFICLRSAHPQPEWFVMKAANNKMSSADLKHPDHWYYSCTKHINSWGVAKGEKTFNLHTHVALHKTQFLNQTVILKKMHSRHYQTNPLICKQTWIYGTEV